MCHRLTTLQLTLPHSPWSVTTVPPGWSRWCMLVAQCGCVLLPAQLGHLLMRETPLGHGYCPSLRLSSSPTHPSHFLPCIATFLHPQTTVLRDPAPGDSPEFSKVPSPLLAAPKPTLPGNPILSRVEKTTRAYLPLLASGLGPWGHPPHYLAFASWPGS